MTHFEKLCGQYAHFFKESGMDLYMDDLGDFNAAKALIDSNDIKAASDFISEMDTSPRESLLIALHKDGFDITEFGFEFL